MFRKLKQDPRYAILTVCCFVLGGALILSLASAHNKMQALTPREAAAAMVPVADLPPAEVMHFWISGSERAALNEIRAAYTGEGGRWIDNAQLGHGELRRALIERISTGTPPAAVLWQSNIELRDLAEVGVFGNLDAVAAREDWDSLLAPAVRARTQIDGHYYMAPTNIHGLNWVFYNRPLLQRLGIAEPRSWPELMSAMRRAEAAGVIPIAIGEGDWESHILFATVLAGTLGREDYRALISDLDESIVSRPGVIEAFEIFAEMRDMIERHRRYPTWAEAARGIVTGEAAFQFMGDWAKGEMARANGAPGREYGCMLAPGTQNAIILTIDGFAFPVATDPARAAARDRLAATIFDRDVQARFAIAKGTLPARADAAEADLDQCERIMVRNLSDPESTIEPPNAGLPSALAGDFQTLVYTFHDNPAMTPEQARDGLARIFRR